MSRPTIAFVSQPWARALPPSESVAIWTREVARRLAGEVDVVVYARGVRRAVEVERAQGVEYRLVAAELDWRFMKAVAPLRRVRPARRPFFAGYLFHPAYLAAVARDVQRLRPAVVHVHNFSQFVPVIRRASGRSRPVLHMHCEWLSQLARPMIRRRLRSADLVVGCSEHVARRIRARFPEFARRVATVPNGVDVDRFEPVTEPPGGRLLFSGRVAPDKGIHVLCDAFRTVRRRFSDAELELVGPEAPVAREMQVALSGDPLVRRLEGFYGRSYLAALTARLGGDAGAVRFAGPVPFDEMPGRYAAATVVVNPSLEEAFGMALVEGMAAGLPAVATEVGGMPEIVVQGVTGLLVPPDDSPALAAAIMRLLEDRELARRLGAAGRTRAVERYSWDVVADEMLALYRRLLDG
jgi:glycosyltransferase involved in cell wall biosynthesis